ncbi:MAG: hypothetical protein RQ751_07225 [Longimicrobiales bacterium]|nr:hypothetical protein [Longimicrobiales bacterium]
MSAAGAVTAGVLAFAAACGPAPEEGPAPAQIVADSLGLGPGERVHEVRILHRNGRERAEPDSLEVRPGDRVDFTGADGRARVVTFPRAGVAAAPRDFLDGSAVHRSPPLLGRDVHWVVPFRAAPEGRYPFTVSGSGADGAGVVIVRVPEGRRRGR